MSFEARTFTTPFLLFRIFSTHYIHHDTLDLSQVLIKIIFSHSFVSLPSVKGFRNGTLNRFFLMTTVCRQLMREEIRLLSSLLYYSIFKNYERGIYDTLKLLIGISNQIITFTVVLKHIEVAKNVNVDTVSSSRHKDCWNLNSYFQD